MRYHRRRIPREGGGVLVVFLDARVPGTVISVAQDHREIEVELESGERLRFRLVAATGIFRSVDASRARLLFE
ncbi:MAG TPA: hypothetical protein VG321_03730 [Solirubrobacteraceae bacterium]|jgi:hypothetical protein|nr:hypothetical protein [Solirubrobacteraceae bacterium]